MSIPSRIIKNIFIRRYIGRCAVFAPIDLTAIPQSGCAMRGVFVFLFLVRVRPGRCRTRPGRKRWRPIRQLPRRPPTPAKPPASAIIPGSPLAALTGAAAPATPANGAERRPHPFGTAALGLSVTRFLDREAAEPVMDFVSAIQKSTTLTPVWHWLVGFGSDPARRAGPAGYCPGAGDHAAAGGAHRHPDPPVADPAARHAGAAGAGAATVRQVSRPRRSAQGAARNDSRRRRRKRYPRRSREK